MRGLGLYREHARQLTCCGCPYSVLSLLLLDYLCAQATQTTLQSPVLYGVEQQTAALAG